MDLSLMDMWSTMGPVAKGIVFVLAIMSIYSLTVMVSKWWSLRKAQKETIQFAPEFSQFLEADNLTDAIKLAQSYKRSHAPLGRGGGLGGGEPPAPAAPARVRLVRGSRAAKHRHAPPFGHAQAVAFAIVVRDHAAYGIGGDRQPVWQEVGEARCGPGHGHGFP